MASGKQEVGFSGFDVAIEGYRKQLEQRRRVSSISPFCKAESGSKRTEERRKRAIKNFWYFEKVYFTRDMYSDGYSKPGKFHRDLISIASKPGLQVVLGARKHGKTATMKKFFVWLLLSGKVSFGATLSQTLTTSRNILSDIYSLMFDNARIMQDFRLELNESNSDQISFIINKENTVRVSAFSEGRSMRGATRLFDRPQFVLVDDLETNQSPMGEVHTEARLKLLFEAFHSLSDRGTVVVLGNNFDNRCALNRLLMEQNEGVLAEHIRVWVFPAWSCDGPLWRERYPASSESELRSLLQVSDDSEWYSDFQQEPVPADGFVFKRLSKLPTFDDLPEDVRGVIFCDPNLAKKGRGDSTAIVSLLYSPSKDYYYVSDLVCRSFSDSNDLLNVVFAMKNEYHRAIGFDGNVSQESTWSNLVRNWCRLHSIPFPRIEYCRYKVDELAKNIQGVWNEGRIFLPANVSFSEDGRRFLQQLFSFQGKRANLPDDGPDALISAFELLHSRRLGRRAKHVRPAISMRDYYI